MEEHIHPVELEKAYRLINHGPVVLVSARHDGVDNVMAASWVCALDFAPPKLTLVLSKASKTREFLEKSGMLVVQVPTAAQADLVHAVGNTSLADDPRKLEHSGVDLYRIPGYDLPFVRGCSAWMACRVIPEPRNQATYDLFMAEVLGAWADDRVFRDGHWEFEQAGLQWRSLHYVAGGQFYTTGEAVRVAGAE